MPQPYPAAQPPTRGLYRPRNPGASPLYQCFSRHRDELTTAGLIARPVESEVLERFYPAIEPLMSWSRYLRQLAPWYEKNIGPGWTDTVRKLLDLLKRGDEVRQMMQVTGEEGVSIDDFVEFQKASFLDLVYLQQDAFNPVDASVSIERQQKTLELIDELVSSDYDFDSKEEARKHFMRLTNLFKNLNYARENAPEYASLMRQIEALDSESLRQAD